MSHPILTAYRSVRAEMSEACTRAGRAPDAVSLVAVTKTHEADAILPVLEDGHRVFGENRVQEAKGKWPQLKARFPGVELHLIGPLQTNKAAEAVALFDVIQTVDRDRLVAALAREMERQKKTPQLYVQVNTGLEPQKAGLAPDQVAGFIRNSERDFGIRYAGLMCIPPVDQDPAPHFRMLANLAKANGLAGLSMGMSSDFAVAIAEGATAVRVGSAIFGARPTAIPAAP
ncbi:MAG: YggS family pyridoxal phosphate-dependent enzyme [Rhizobiales bacterium]|nr:YggS family pyridoxal phosphate-dependent enzyme [Hyphomicrobiales bacterium]